MVNCVHSCNVPYCIAHNKFGSLPFSFIIHHLNYSSFASFKITLALQFLYSLISIWLFFCTSSNLSDTPFFICSSSLLSQIFPLFPLFWLTFSSIIVGFPLLSPLILIFLNSLHVFSAYSIH